MLVNIREEEFMLFPTTGTAARRERDPVGPKAEEPQRFEQAADEVMLPLFSGRQEVW